MLYAKFLTYPGVRLVRPGLWEVVSEGRIEYQIDVGKNGVLDGRTGLLIIPVGFRFDGASIPPLVRFLLAPTLVALGMTKTDMQPAASGHDRAYWEQLEKELADKIFYALLRRRANSFSGFGCWRRLVGARLAYWAVKFGGGMAYAAHGMRERAGD